MTDFSFITTSKGRLHHLQQTLPLLAQQENCETVVVDYNCPQRTGDWVEANFPQFKVVRVTDDDHFCLARARNLGAQASTAPWLVFIDADIRLVDDLPGWLRPRLAPATYFRAGITSLDNFGTCACQRSDFETIGGYDEVLRGWGMEDNDLYYRLRASGCKQEVFPGEFLDAIPHGHEERTQFSLYKNRWVSHIIAALYLQMKYDLDKLLPEKPGREMHRRLYEHARQNVLRIIRQGDKADMRVRVPLGDHPGLPNTIPAWGIERVLVYTLRPHAAGAQLTA